MNVITACLLAVLVGGCTTQTPPLSRPGSTTPPNWTAKNWKTTCRYDTTTLPELSGLAPSVRHKGILWAINDGGNANVIYALDASTCTVRGQYSLTTPTSDSEALASGRNAKGRPVLWVGDIGDNLSQRSDVAILEIPEPALGSTSGPATRHEFSYPGGPRDAEALMAAPDGRNLFVVSKQLPRSTIYQVPIRSGRVRAEAVGRAPAFITDAGVNPKTGDYALRDYAAITRFAGPIPGRRLGRVAPPPLRQAEAVAFSRNGRAIFTASESDDRLLRAEVLTANGNHFQ